MTGIFSRRNLLIGAGVAGAAAAGGATYVLNKPGAALAPGVSRAAAIVSDETLPDAADVVVIGGGNLGTMTALTLAERGVSVALCEKGVIGGEASCRSFGLIENIAAHPIKLEMACRSKSMWKDINQRTGHETGYAREGLVMNLYDEGMQGFLESWIEQTRGMPECDARLITAAERDQLVPGLAAKGVSAVYQPSDARAEPTLAAPAFALGARAKGAQIFQNCAVRGIERSAGRISAVVTERGRIACQSVVLTGGAWTPLFLRSLGEGLDLPQFDLSGSQYSIALENGPTTTCLTNDVAWRRQFDGNFGIGVWRVSAALTPHLLRYLPQIMPYAGAMMQSTYPNFSASRFWDELTTPSRWALDQPSPFEKNRILQPELASDVLAFTLARARAAYPAFQNARIADQWAGFMSVMLDNLPVISAIDAVPGLNLATGFSFGLAWAPATGEALADLATGQTPKVDLTPYRFSRFTDGSKLEFIA